MARPGPLPPDAGGDPACWANRVCPECGAFSADGYHRQGCITSGFVTSGPGAGSAGAERDDRVAGDPRTPPREDVDMVASIEAVKPTSPNWP